MSNGNIGGIVGAGMNILALGMVADIAMKLTANISKQAKVKTGKQTQIYKIIWG